MTETTTTIEPARIRWLLVRIVPFLVLVFILQQIGSQTSSLQSSPRSPKKRKRTTQKYLNRSHSVIKISDMTDLTDDSLFPHNGDGLSLKEAVDARKPVLDLINRAGLEVDSEVLHKLPRWAEFTELYGKDPVIRGMDTCKQFRSENAAEQRFVAIGGQMNAGTNAMAKYLFDNLAIPANPYRQGLVAQLPWNKHGWVGLRGVYRFRPPYNVSSVLPVIIIRDPYFWMRSMCESPYTMQWKQEGDHCPNLINETLKPKTLTEEVGNPVKILWGRDYLRRWQSLAHVWSEWYSEYYEADFPRLMIRFEDLLFRTPEVFEKIRECAGASWKHDKFVFTTKPMKQGVYYEKIKPQSSMLSAMIKNGQDRGGRRVSNMTENDQIYAQIYLNQTLMHLFGYHHPE